MSVTFIENPDNNTVYQKVTRTTRSGRVFSSTRYLCPYYQLRIDAPATATVNNTFTTTVYTVNWKGEPINDIRTVTLTVRDINGNAVQELTGDTNNGSVSFDITIDATGNYVLVANTPNWEEAVWQIEVQEQL